ncbi:ribonuclease HII family protein [Asticcacaulis biprosthecium C19]|uniref:Ribonuclease HII n=1 Tax=Asticcacaulis biprosthecium C19 TaxID=715226 RepID=F4QPP3_9CAUL|nr:ribonuclease HII [Asticcacaulis biprosthecium]EGF90180.1 ribonuclease HII family protein [Asticcacaulis biprosthecium C19]
MADFSHEQRIAGLVCGVDEAGRGPCAGPLCVAAVILDPARTPEGIDDSKALTEARRFQLEPLIKHAAIAWSVITMSTDDIDSMNILAATLEGMSRAVMALNPNAHHALIDGNRCPKQLSISATAVIGGDALSLSIAAASILAKTARDRIMIELDAVYPQYGFKRHKGYQTGAHLEALRVHGPSPVHRKSWATLRQLSLPLDVAE